MENGEIILSNDENLPVYLSSMVRENVFYRKWHSWFHFLRDIVLWSHDSHIFVTSRYVCEYWNEAHFSTLRMNDPTRNKVARLISARIIMHNLIFWNYIRFEKVRDLKYIFKRELITYRAYHYKVLQRDATQRKFDQSHVAVIRFLVFLHFRLLQIDLKLNAEFHLKNKFSKQCSSIEKKKIEIFPE